MKQRPKIYIFENSFRMSFDKTVRKSLFVMELVHNDSFPEFDLSVIDGGVDKIGFFTQKPVENEIWVYCQSKSRNLLISCPLLEIDFNHYYMTKMVTNRKIKSLDVSYTGPIKTRTENDFRMKFGEFRDMDSSRYGELSLSRLV